MKLLLTATSSGVYFFKLIDLLGLVCILLKPYIFKAEFRKVHKKLTHWTANTKEETWLESA